MIFFMLAYFVIDSYFGDKDTNFGSFDSYNWIFFEKRIKNLEEIKSNLKFASRI
jgi:hypothetical protein